MKENKVFATVKDYAELKKVSLKTVYNWIEDGKLITKKILNTTLIQL